ncbi:hypothetical protein MATR_03270 [Marivirga tractuosa]|uniref:Uncharacterized protein n=1 Tax=Marivirga tractuosa (strain ATCC 23168 / DSM 4126 / NBRC 15989 / NCIMB 1408 / VKM B-1430 / H-43) TaxID=643867 RepID=E4TUC1_MARTH|nr:hypothetical protein [Marivirga tractuosa]ADR22039.1 hypothetical protein Ftrac_2054 [Marivirga tractuosa DSM 4126]BDD13502.1 hypothetical protein MATR_03270 [Marivirga tractuosa]
MPNFTIVFKDDSIKEIEAESKEALIRDFSLADATAFQEMGLFLNCLREAK